MPPCGTPTVSRRRAADSNSAGTGPPETQVVEADPILVVPVADCYPGEVGRRAPAEGDVPHADRDGRPELGDGLDAEHPGGKVARPPPSVTVRRRRCMPPTAGPVSMPPPPASRATPRRPVVRRAARTCRGTSRRAPQPRPLTATDPRPPVIALRPSSTAKCSMRMSETAGFLVTASANIPPR